MQKKILLVEDSEVDITLFSDILIKNKYDVYSAKTIEEGYKKAMDVEPDLILLDIMLPDGDGFELCRRIKNDTSLKRKPLVIMLSSKNELEDIEKAFNAKADDYVVKPPILEPLLRKVKLYLHE